MTAFHIDVLSPDTEAAYARFLDALPGAMLYHGLAYRTFLHHILPHAHSQYFLLFDGGEIVGALPAFFLDGPYGTVANSLPFYGSHGGILARDVGIPAVADALLESFYAYCETLDVTFSTLVESPFAFSKPLCSLRPFDAHDKRIGQFTDLPDPAQGQDIPARLLALCHQKTRNMVRKGCREGFLFQHDDSLIAMEALHEMHAQNMTVIGGVPKPWEIFLAIRDTFQYDTDYRVYVAREGEQIVSGLLLLYFKGTVEYFCPATLASHRSRQPLSGLIYTSMAEAVQQKGSSLWNWGGTWTSQDGVYRFKSRWGARDVEYRYAIRLHKGRACLAGMTPDRLLTAYPFFYTVPFSTLEHPPIP